MAGKPPVRNQLTGTERSSTDKQQLWRKAVVYLKRKNHHEEAHKKATLFIFLGGEWEEFQSMAVMLFWHKMHFSKFKSSIRLAWKMTCGL